MKKYKVEFELVIDGDRELLDDMLDQIDNDAMCLPYMKDFEIMDVQEIEA